MTTATPPPAAETLRAALEPFDIGDLIGRLRDDAGLSKERSTACRKIGNTDGQVVASQIADDLDEAAHVLTKVRNALAAPDDIACAGAIPSREEALHPAKVRKARTVIADITGAYVTEKMAENILKALLPARPEPVVDGAAEVRRDLTDGERLTVRRLEVVVKAGFVPRPDTAHVLDVKHILSLVSDLSGQDHQRGGE